MPGAQNFIQLVLLSIIIVTSGEPLFSFVNIAKLFGGRAPPGPAKGAHSTPSDLLAGCRMGRKGKEGRMGREGGEGREVRRGGRNERERC
jgi:hypothetical protein